MKVLLVDDERLARKKLQDLLLEFSDLQVVGECANGAEALDAVQDHDPNLIFLDIEMPELNGFEFLEKLPPPHPFVIFTTAYNEFAVKAFEVNALDYLTKPIEIERLREAVARFRKQAEIRQKATVTSRESQSSEYFHSTDKVFVREGDKCWFVQIGNIRLLESEGSYTRICFEDNKPLIYRSLNYLEPKLNPSGFFRANRSQIVNLKMVDKVEPWFSGNLKLTLKGGEQVELSRRQAKAFRDTYSL